MKCRILFSGKNKENIIKSSADLAKTVAKAKRSVNSNCPDQMCTSSSLSGTSCWQSLFARRGTCTVHLKRQLQQTTFEPEHDNTYNKTYATSEDSDPRSLISLRACLLQPPGYPNSYKGEPLLYLVDVQADLSLYW